MADFTDRIRIIVSTITDVSGIKSFRTAVQEADGVTGKFKAGAVSAFETVKNNAGLLALGAGVALVEFGIAAFNSFEKVALGARNLSSHVGLTIEDASRWNGAAKDLGLSADVLYFGLSRVAKTIDDTKWGDYGIKTHDAAGQILPINDILLQTSDVLRSVEDNATRAAIGNDLFGRGYNKISPMIDRGSESLKAYLAHVEKGQVITEEELHTAEAAKKAQADLGQAFQELGFHIGGMLAKAAPAIETLAHGVIVVADLTGRVLDMFFATDSAGKSVDIMGKHFDKLNLQAQAQAIEDMTNAAEKASGGFKRLGDFIGGNVGLLDENLYQFQNLEKAITDLNKTDPAGAHAVVDSLQAIRDAAAQGDQAAQIWLDHWQLSAKDMDRLKSKLDPVVDSLGNVIKTSKDMELEQKALDDALKEHDQLLAENKKKLDAINSAYEDGKKRLEDYKKSQEEINKAQQDAITVQGDFEQTVRDLESAYFDLHTKVDENIKTQKDGKLSDEEKAQSTRDVESAQHDLANSVADASVKYAESKGAIDNSNASIALQIDFLNLAKAKYPELGPVIDGYIARLQSIPTKIVTDVSVIGHLDSIIIDGETHAAGVVHISATTAAVKRNQAGGTLTAGFTTLNENGQEAIFLPNGTKVLGASQTAHMQPPYQDHSTTIVHMPPGLNPAAINDAVNKGRRRGGRP